jgi:very-short-patch-repair endonuclease
MIDQPLYKDFRAAIRRYLDSEFSCGHADLPDQCRALLLAHPPTDGTKRERLAASLDATPDAQLPKVAEQLLGGGFRLSASMRNAIQELIWAGRRCPMVELRVRRELAQGLDIEQLFRDATGFMDLLEQFWVLDTDTFADLVGGRPNGLRQSIERHVLRNPGDWSAEDLFSQLGAMEASDARFCHFLEALTSHRVHQDEQRQRNLVGVLNSHLRASACELRETDTEGGYPMFTLVSLHPGSAGRPKQLIFASSVKPDLRLRDAISNDIEIVTHADKVLVYDRPIGRDGLPWSDLQAWWSELRQIPNDERAKATLWNRLLGCLPENSPAQRQLFLAFYSAFGSATSSLPALVPEVWLHWDPKTVRERGDRALPRFRMDFLLLLPGGYRVVIEVDGKHHYATENGQASPDRYADMVSADRNLKLAGYEVFRFGVAELKGPDSEAMVQDFFRSLLRSHGLTVPSGSPPHSKP